MFQDAMAFFAIRYWTLCLPRWGHVMASDCSDRQRSMTSISLSRILEYWCEQHGERDAVVHGEQRITWVELDRRSNRLARAYQAMGVEADDFVTIALPNGIEFFESVFAAHREARRHTAAGVRAPAPVRTQSDHRSGRAETGGGRRAGQPPGRGQRARGFSTGPGAGRTTDCPSGQPLTSRP
ncbi:MAG: AMP-binding protein [Gammaproteobacteria bacterium]|nr:AMP-binding protein [Gammaproteobacteria bacterium]